MDYLIDTWNWLLSNAVWVLIVMSFLVVVLLVFNGIIRKLLAAVVS